MSTQYLLDIFILFYLFDYVHMQQRCKARDIFNRHISSRQFITLAYVCKYQQQLFLFLSTFLL